MDFDSKYLTRTQALTNLERRRQFHDAIVEKYPPSNPWVVHVKAKLAEAEAEYDRVTSDL
jgi:hypothetical protein